MKNRAKPVDTEQDESFNDNFHCEKHPFSSPIGICAHCLKERLLNLVCSDCGKQRLSSSCSCSEISSSFYSNYGFNGNIEIGSVGRVSFLIENEKTEQEQPSFFPISKANLLKRSFSIKSNFSSHVGIKRNNNRFCRIVNFFKKKSDSDDKSNDFSVSDHKMGGISVSRSRSICSFMGVDCMSVNGSLVQDSSKKSGFSENEARKSGLDLDSENELKMKESGLVKSIDGDGDDDDSSFIELKQDVIRGSFRSLIEDDNDDGIHSNGSSRRRIIVNEGRIKKSRKSLKVWRWIFPNHRHRQRPCTDDHDSNCGIARKKHEDHA